MEDYIAVFDVASSKWRVCKKTDKVDPALDTIDLGAAENNIEAKDMLYSRLLESYPAAPGHTRLISLPGYTYIVVCQGEQPNIEDMEGLKEYAKEYGSVIVYSQGDYHRHGYYGGRLSSILKDFGDKHTYNLPAVDGPFVLFSAGDDLVLEYNPKRAKSIRNRRKNLKKKPKVNPDNLLPLAPLRTIIDQILEAAQKTISDPYRLIRDRFISYGPGRQGVMARFNQAVMLLNALNIDDKYILDKGLIRGLVELEPYLYKSIKRPAEKSVSRTIIQDLILRVCHSRIYMSTRASYFRKQFLPLKYIYEDGYTISARRHFYWLLKQ